MSALTGHLILLATALAAGGIGYLCCLGLFSFYKPLPVLLIVALALAAYFWGSNEPTDPASDDVVHFVFFLIIFGLPILVGSAASMYFMVNTVPVEPKISTCILAYVALIPTHVACGQIYNALNDSPMVAHALPPSVASFRLHYYALTYLCPTLVAAIIWRGLKPKHQVRFKP